jgi:hypothetical protein
MTSAGVVNVTVPGTIVYAPTQTASLAPGAVLPARLSNGEVATLLAGNTASGVASDPGRPVVGPGLRILARYDGSAGVAVSRSL